MRRMRLRLPISLVLALVTVASVAGGLADTGHAAQLIGRDARNLRLEVDGRGEALLLFSSGGKRNHVLVWGAINALPRSAARPQVQFKVDYSGGWGKYHRHLFGGRVYWQTFKNACSAYDGPPLPYQIAACDAPDGSYWAVQQWPQPLPDLGFTPWLASQRQNWTVVSHWSGPLPQLTAYTDWVYGHVHHLFGNFTYRGQAVYGFHTTRFGVPTDTYGRLVYLDTLGSTYGPGWRRENSFVTQSPNGGWCYGFFTHDPKTGGYQHPAGQTQIRPSGMGTRYRLLADGPGVTPYVQAVVNDPGDWNPADPTKVSLLQSGLALLPSVIGADPTCLKGHDITAP
jgi:hypothetical protein